MQPRPSPRSGLAVLAAVFVTGFLALSPIASRADNHVPSDDGPPEISFLLPQAGPTAGGTPVRISGAGFGGTTQVLIGGVPVLDFAVIDSTLLTVTTPPAATGPAANNTSVEVTVTDNEGSDTGNNTDENTGFYYTDAIMTLTPNTGVGLSDTVNVSVSGYAPSAGVALPVLNPLVGYLEEGPAFPPGPPPYATQIDFGTTDAQGGLNQNVVIRDLQGNTFLDPEAVCPPSQEAADYGLADCLIAVSQFAIGSLERFFSLEGAPVPADPTLELSTVTANVGDNVDLSGVNWNAAARFGSDTTPDDPGETEVIVEICTTDLAACTQVVADATVELTRYRDSDPATAGVQGSFSGATLDGSFTVDDASGCPPDCIVRVSQQRFDPNLSVPLNTSIAATASLSISGAPTTTTSSTTTSTTSTTLAPTTTSTSSTSTTLAATTTTTSPPNDPLTIDDVALSNGQVVRITGEIACNSGRRFRIEVTVSQGETIAEGVVTGSCRVGPQSFRVVVVATSGPAFEIGDAQVGATAQIGNAATRTIEKAFSTNEEVQITVPEGFMGQVVNAFLAMEDFGGR